MNAIRQLNDVFKVLRREKCSQNTHIHDEHDVEILDCLQRESPPPYAIWSGVRISLDGDRTDPLLTFSEKPSDNFHVGRRRSNSRIPVGEMENPPVRLLVVDDFAPFLQFISSRLAGRRDLQIVCEISDGEEAVRKATELKPDLILLDVGLPSLSGIEAARQIRKLVPESKIIFVSQQSAPHIVQEALNLGAWGYVLKPNVATDLLPAIDAVLDGRQFVSAGLISDSPA